MATEGEAKPNILQKTGKKFKEFFGKLFGAPLSLADAILHLFSIPIVGTAEVISGLFTKKGFGETVPRMVGLATLGFLAFLLV